MRRVVSRSWKEGKHYIFFFWHRESAGRDKMLWKQMVAIVGQTVTTFKDKTAGVKGVPKKAAGVARGSRAVVGLA